MGWQLLKPTPKRAGRPPALGSLAMRQGKRGCIATLNLSRDLIAGLGWQPSATLLIASIGDGADRGWLRLAPDPAGEFKLLARGGKGSGSGKVVLGVVPQLEDDNGKHRLDADAMKPGEDHLLVRLPADALRRTARAACPPPRPPPAIPPCALAPRSGRSALPVPIPAARSAFTLSITFAAQALARTRAAASNASSVRLLR
jgi:hypothetical protein